MDTKLIKELITLVETTGICELEIEESGCRIRLKGSDVSRQQKEGISENITEICEDAVYSPMLGVFYAAPSPQSEPFVKVGDKIRKGDTLCIIEAMKLMNEISSDKDGEISEICISDGQIAEYGQILFKLV